MLINIAVLITCHDRKLNTLACLKALFDQYGLGLKYEIKVFLVDDACTDGTSDAIRIDFPQVKIIQGNGNLFWNRGMYLAWSTATLVSNFDYYLWLNDDTFLFSNAIDILFKEKFFNAIVCGTTKSKLHNNATYGAFSSNSNKIIIPNGKYQISNYCNGNCVLIPSTVYNQLGNLDPTFHHALGDFDYGKRAQKRGVEIMVAPDFVGFCETHETVPKWRCNSLGFIERLKNLYGPNSGCNPTEFFLYDKRHSGLFVAIVHYFTIHLRCFFPFIWINK